MFLLVCLISGPAGAGSGEDSPSYVLQVHKVTSGEDGTTLLLIFGFSVTSRRGLPTSRRQFYIPLSRRDVDFPRRDINFHFLCHVATWTSHVATSLLQVSVTSRRSPSRRDVSFYQSLSRRDVSFYQSLSRRDVT